jgi:hypothetical protein
MVLNRDDFTKKTVDILAKRVGYLCSNPKCRKLTVGPNSNKGKATIIGIAAHITAASAGGPRYDSTLTPEERKDIDNGIWLCTNCSTLIDKDPVAFTVNLLNDWKKNAEDIINKELLGIKLDSERPYLEADLIWVNNQRWNRGYSSKNREKYGSEIVVGRDKPIILWDLVWNFHITIFNNSKHPAFNVKIEQIDGTKLYQLDELPKVNNLPPYADLRLKARFEDFIEGTSAEADERIKPKIPDVVQGLKMRITYIDENGNEHATIFTVNGDEFNNTKE